mmetsp:Transcript_35536/g.92624  ORF Transcript_35536/g.92624 Transcript_35536/m.92624 type:complete len:204 (-) Transcript_35536:767-1378(-)
MHVLFLVRLLYLKDKHTADEADKVTRISFPKLFFVIAVQVLYNFEKNCSNSHRWRGGGGEDKREIVAPLCINWLVPDCHIQYTLRHSFTFHLCIEWPTLVHVFQHLIIHHITLIDLALHQLGLIRAIHLITHLVVTLRELVIRKLGLIRQGGENILGHLFCIRASGEPLNFHHFCHSGCVRFGDLVSREGDELLCGQRCSTAQ